MLLKGTGHAGGRSGLDNVFARMQSRTHEPAGELGEEETSMLGGSRADEAAPDIRMPWGRSWGRH